MEIASNFCNKLSENYDITVTISSGLSASGLNYKGLTLFQQQKESFFSRNPQSDISCEELIQILLRLLLQIANISLIPIDYYGVFIKRKYLVPLHIDGEFWNQHMITSSSIMSCNIFITSKADNFPTSIRYYIMHRLLRWNTTITATSGWGFSLPRFSKKRLWTVIVELTSIAFSLLLQMFSSGCVLKRTRENEKTGFE